MVPCGKREARAEKQTGNSSSAALLASGERCTDDVMRVPRVLSIAKQETNRRYPRGGQAWYASPAAKARGAITRRSDRNDKQETKRTKNGTRTEDSTRTKNGTRIKTNTRKMHGKLHLRGWVAVPTLRDVHVHTTRRGI
jgi:hypothetical protein